MDLPAERASANAAVAAAARIIKSASAKTRPDFAPANLMNPIYLSVSGCSFSPPARCSLARSVCASVRLSARSCALRPALDRLD